MMVIMDSTSRETEITIEFRCDFNQYHEGDRVTLAYTAAVGRLLAGGQAVQVTPCQNDAMHVDSEPDTGMPSFQTEAQSDHGDKALARRRR